jgi:hypothetical protein
LVRTNSGDDKKEFLIQRCGEFRQIPIPSLNVIQAEANIVPIDRKKWYYHLSQEQLDSIYFVCESNQDEFDACFGQDSDAGISAFCNEEQPLSLPTKKRDVKKKEKFRRLIYTTSKIGSFDDKQQKVDEPFGFDASEFLRDTRSKDKKRIKVFNDLGMERYGTAC